MCGPNVELSIPTKANKAKEKQKSRPSSDAQSVRSDPSALVESEEIGISDEDPDDMSPIVDVTLASFAENLSSEWTIAGNINFLLIEVCCYTDSPLASHFDSLEECKAWRVLEEHDFRKFSTVLNIEQSIGKAREVNPNVRVWIHFSLPCAGGSRLIQRRSVQRADRQKGNDLRIAFKQMLASSKMLVRSLKLDKMDQASFELSATCSYWKWRTVHRLRMVVTPYVWFAACPRLCAKKEGQTADGRRPLSKAWRIISTSPCLTTSLKQFEMCQHEAHTGPDYRSTSRYPLTLVKALCRSFTAKESIPPDLERVW